MRPSRGMGAIKKTKIPSAKENTMPKGVVKKRRDNTDFTQFKEGGMVEKKKGGMLDSLQKAAPYSKKLGKKEGGNVNAAGNYTKPTLRKSIVSQVKAAATHGTGAGQWSARKAQLVAKKYKASGGGYK
jgi:hypothetical protein